LSSGADKLARRSRNSARVLLLVFVVWQLGAVLHLVLDTHCILPDGRIADIDPDTGEPIPEDNGPGSSGGCPVLDKMTSATTLTSEFVAVTDFQFVDQIDPVDEAAVPAAGGRELFMLSPSNSPPPLS
jgi:hypothetical protein